MKILFKNILLFALILINLMQFKTLFQYKFYESDFMVYHAVAKLYLKNPNVLYIKNDQDVAEQMLLRSNDVESKGYGPFVNPPLVLLAFLPFTSLNTHTAFLITIVLYLVVTLFFPMLFQKLLSSNTKIQLWEYLYTISFAPLFVTVVATQTTLLYILIFLLFIALYKKEKLFWAGFTAAFLWLSPQLALLFSFLLILSKSKDLKKGFILGIVIFVLLNALMTKSFIFDYYQLLVWYATFYEQTYVATNVLLSLEGFVVQMSHFLNLAVNHKLAFIISLGVIIANLVVFWKLRKSSDSVWLGIPVALIGALVTGMHVHIHSAAILLIVYWYFRNYYNGVKLLVVSLITYLIFMLTFYSPFYPVGFYFVPNLSLVILWVFSVYSALKSHTLPLKQ